MAVPAVFSREKDEALRQRWVLIRKHPTHPQPNPKTEKTGGQPRPPVFSCSRSSAPVPARICESEAGRIRATAIPTGASFPHTVSLSAGNCHGAEPTAGPALLTAPTRTQAPAVAGHPAPDTPATPLSKPFYQATEQQSNKQKAKGYRLLVYSPSPYYIWITLNGLTMPYLNLAKETSGVMQK